MIFVAPKNAGQWLLNCHTRQGGHSKGPYRGMAGRTACRWLVELTTDADSSSHEMYSIPPHY